MTARNFSTATQRKIRIADTDDHVNMDMWIDAADNRYIACDLTPDLAREVGRALIDAADAVPYPPRVDAHREHWSLVHANLAASEAVLNTLKMRDCNEAEMTAVRRLLDAQNAVKELM